MTGHLRGPGLRADAQQSKSTSTPARTARPSGGNLISTIAGHAIDHPGEKVDPKLVFPRYVEKLREAYYGEHKKQVGALARDMLVVLDEGPGLPADRRALAEATLQALLERYGYVKESAREALGELVKERYAT